LQIAAEILPDRLLAFWCPFLAFFFSVSFFSVSFLAFGTYVDRFGDHLAQARLQARNEQIIDASIVRVPIQRNSRDENRRINAGEVPEDWDEHKRRQKDNDARWTSG
jgi:hypothetical protein